jgi:transcriptional regulator
MTRQPTRGHLDLLLLGVLCAGPAHGYAIITALRERSGGVFELTEGSLYPALHRLEAAGSLVSEWEPVDGRRRKYYRLTPAGAAALESERAEWIGLSAAINAVLTSARPGTGALA